jgi:hypothetical protein
VDIPVAEVVSQDDHDVGLPTGAAADQRETTKPQKGQGGGLGDGGDVRLDLAKRLLSSSEMSITEVGHTCGFDEPNKFYVFFKREAGKSPTQWRISLTQER